MLQWTFIYNPIILELNPAFTLLKVFHKLFDRLPSQIPHRQPGPRINCPSKLQLEQTSSLLVFFFVCVILSFIWIDIEFSQLDDRQRKQFNSTGLSFSVLFVSHNQPWAERWDETVTSKQKTIHRRTLAKVSLCLSNNISVYYNYIRTETVNQSDVRNVSNSPTTRRSSR